MTTPALRPKGPPPLSPGHRPGSAGKIGLRPVGPRHDIRARKAASASALLDGCGNVVGVISQSIDPQKTLESNGSLPQNVNYAIKSQYLLRLLESVPELSKKLKPPGKEGKRAEEISTSAE